MTMKAELEGDGAEQGSAVHKSAAAIREPAATGALGHVAGSGSAFEVSGQQSEDLFRLLVNGVKDYAIYMLDAAGNVTSWNAGAEHINGYKSDEVLGKNFSLFYEHADAKSGRPQEALAIAARTGHAEEEGWRVRKLVENSEISA